MPRKIAGIAMMTMEASIVAMVMLSVVLDRAIHLYRSPRPAPPALDCLSAEAPAGPPLATAAFAPLRLLLSAPLPPSWLIFRTCHEPTASHLLNHNYLPAARMGGAPAAGGGAAIRWRASR